MVDSNNSTKISEKGHWIAGTLSGFYSWLAGTLPPNPLTYTGLDLSGQLVQPDTQLPGLCCYLGPLVCADALAADYRYAESRGHQGLRIVVKTRLWTPHPGLHAWDWWADGQGELVDLRERRCSRQVTAQVREVLGTKKPRQVLANHPERIREVAGVFPQAHVIVWRVDTADGLRRPVAWLRSPARVVSISIHYQSLLVILPEPSWSGWSVVPSPAPG